MLTPEQKVAVAKDEIKQVKLSVFKPVCGTFYYGREMYGTTKPQEFARSINKCSVCARGALFIASVAKYNKWKPEDEKLTSGAWKKVNRDWGKSQQALMEIFFENYVGSAKARGKVIAAKLEKFVKKYPKPTDRLIAIMRNVIKNKGVFKP